VVTALAGALAPYLSALPGTAALAAGAPATLALRLAGALLPGSYQGALTLNLAAATAAGRRANACRPAPWPQLTAIASMPTLFFIVQCSYSLADLKTTTKGMMLAWPCLPAKHPVKR